MKIADLIRSMTAAGAPPEAIALAVEAIEAGWAKDEDRRAKQAARKARSRAVKRDSHGTVTGQSQDPSPPPAPSPEPPTPPAPTPTRDPRLPSEAAPKGACRGSTLPPDWEPKPRHFAKATALGLPERWVRDRAEAMREWAGANRNRALARKADWDLTFDGFLRRDAPTAKSGKSLPLLMPIEGGGEPRVDFGGGYSAPEATIIRFIREGRWPSHGWGPPPGQDGCRVPERLIQAARQVEHAA